MRTGRTWVVLLLLGVTTASAEEVSVSRYRITASVGAPGSSREQPDPAVLVALCRDADGCDAVLLADQDGLVAVGRQRMTISTTLTDHWASSLAAPGVVYDNGNGVEETVVTSTVDGTCTFSDIDEAGPDTTADFSVTATWGGAPLDCALTLID